MFLAAPFSWQLSQGLSTVCSTSNTWGDDDACIWQCWRQRSGVLQVSATHTPVLLSNLIADGKLLWCYCRECGHERDIPPASLPLPGWLPVSTIGARMVCTVCGSKKIATQPEHVPGGVVAFRNRVRAKDGI